MLVLRDEKPSADAPDPDAFWIIRDDPGLSGTDIKNPEQNFDQQGGNEPIVTFEFSDKGRSAFQSITSEVAQRGADNANPLNPDPNTSSHHFAIALDNELVSIPFINYRENPDGIDGSTGAQISGGFTITSAQDLAKILKTGALPLRLELISRSQVSATLGKQALDQGLVAGIGGFVIVALFLLVFYRVLGVIATVALVIYAIYFYAIIKLIPVTLTLPGIAGLILTLGVAADANIVIFERVKEEVRAGRSVAAGPRRGLQEGHRDDRRRQHRHAARRVHPLHPRHGGGQGLRVRARHRHHAVAVHRGARDPGDHPHPARLADPAQPLSARRREAEAPDHASTSWARRSGSSRPRA